MARAPALNIPIRGMDDIAYTVTVIVVGTINMVDVDMDEIKQKSMKED